MKPQDTSAILQVFTSRLECPRPHFLLNTPYEIVLLPLTPRSFLWYYSVALTKWRNILFSYIV
jgi:hypothetical protein